MFVIVNKPHGLLVHPSDSSNEYTLRDFMINNFNINQVGEYKREGIVHRRDKVTSGIMICPIDSEALHQLQKDFKSRKIKKKYRAITEGFLKSKTGEINVPLIHSQNNRRKREVGKNGRESITKYNTISKTNFYSLLDIDLITGRNHQIRAHLEYLKAPIVNDVLYGAKKVNDLDENTICLQSYDIEFKLFDKDYKFSIDEPDYFTLIMNM